MDFSNSNIDDIERREEFEKNNLASHCSMLAVFNVASGSNPHRKGDSRWRRQWGRPRQHSGRNTRGKRLSQHSFVSKLES